MDERDVLAETLEGVVMRHHVAGHIEAGWLQSLSDDLVSAVLQATPQPEAGLREALAVLAEDHRHRMIHWPNCDGCAALRALRAALAAEEVR